MSSRKNYEDFSELKAQVRAVAAMNVSAIGWKLIELKPKELQNLGKEINDYVDFVFKKLDTVKEEPGSVIEKIGKIAKLEAEIKLKEKSTRMFYRDYFLFQKRITVSHYFSEILIENLILVCEVYTAEFLQTYNAKSDRQKFNEIKSYVLSVPITVTSKSAFKHGNAEGFANELLSTCKEKKLKKELQLLKDQLGKIGRVRELFFILSAIVGIGFYALLSEEWGAPYCNNFLFFMADASVSFCVFSIIFDAFMGIYKRIVFK